MLVASRAAERRSQGWRRPGFGSGAGSVASKVHSANPLGSLAQSQGRMPGDRPTGVAFFLATQEEVTRSRAVRVKALLFKTPNGQCGRRFDFAQGRGATPFHTTVSPNEVEGNGYSGPRRATGAADTA